MKIKKSSMIQIALLLLPGVLIFCIFTLYPIVKLFVMSFFEWDFGSLLEQKFIGMKNYIDVFSDHYFHVVFVNSIVYTLVTVPAQMLIGMLVAMLINSIGHLKIAYRVSYYLPVITSWVIASLIFKYVFNTEGLLNYFLTNIVHVTDHNIRWLDTRWGGMTVAMLLGIWKGIGWNMVVFLAALQTVPQELYESAALDGAGTLRKFIYITIPCIRGTILFALVMLTIGGFNVYTSIKMITDGAPGHQTDTILTWMYYKAFSAGKFGYSAALSFITAAVLALLALLQFRLMENKE
jgi:multiple sugar transport system permease protein